MINDQLTRILRSKPQNLLQVIQSNNQDLLNLQTLLQQRGKQVASLQFILSNEVTMVDKVINTKWKLQQFYDAIKAIIRQMNQLKDYVRKQVKKSYAQVMGEIAKCFKDLCVDKKSREQEINSLNSEIERLNDEIKLRTQQIIHIDRSSSLEGFRQTRIPMLQTGGYTLGNQELKELFSPVNSSILSLAQIKSLKQHSYEGNICKNQKHGKGQAIYERHFSYKGLFKNGQKNGFGQLLFKDQVVYRGDWKKDIFWGKGTLYLKQVSNRYQNGYLYMGNFENGQFHGFGVIQFDDGSRFTSQFSHGKVISPSLLKKNEYMSIMQYQHSISVDPICSK